MSRALPKKLLNGIKEFFSKTGKRKAVLGLSGGVDSALCAKLLTNAIGAKNITALIMPVKGISLKKNTFDAQNLAKELKIKCFVVELKRFIAPYASLPWKQSKGAHQNLIARQRAMLLYDFANSKNAIVCGTGNKSELLLGYFTKFGDGAADFFPIGGLYKTQVKELAKQFRLLNEFIEKTPSAELWKGQTDEQEIGAKYEEIDQILKLLVEKNKTKAQIIKSGYSKKAVERIFDLMAQNQHKTKLPPLIKI